MGVLQRCVALPAAKTELLATERLSAHARNRVDLPRLVATMTATAGDVLETLRGFMDLLRPRRFSERLDVKMKRGAAPYPRNVSRKKPVPRVKGIVRKLLDE